MYFYIIDFTVFVFSDNFGPGMWTRKYIDRVLKGNKLGITAIYHICDYKIVVFEAVSGKGTRTPIYICGKLFSG